MSGKHYFSQGKVRASLYLSRKELGLAKKTIEEITTQ